jgi:uncharacterized protein
MKYLVLLIVIALVLSFVAGRGKPKPLDKRGRGPLSKGRGAAGREEMVRCAHCGLHRPRGEALAGPDGDSALYCSEAHRTLAQRR